MKPYYEDDAVTIYHGDCMDLLPLLSFDCVVTDPPYGINYQPDGSMPGSRVYAPVAGDDRPFDPSPFIDRPCLMWGANHYANRLPNSRGWVAWWKHAYYVADVEFAWSNFLSRPGLIDCEWRGAARGVETGLPPWHPTQKPEAVMRWCVERAPGHTILDPFMGSGTTLRAAKDLGRKAIGIEVDERYCEIAAKRMAQEVLPLDGAA